MKKSLRIVLIIFILSMLGYSLGLSNRYNIITALVDLMRDDIRIVYYGMSGLNDKELERTARENDFQYIRIAGCEVTYPLVNGARHYNWVMKSYLGEKYPEEFLNKF